MILRVMYAMGKYFWDFQVVRSYLSHIVARGGNCRSSLLTGLSLPWNN